MEFRACGWLFLKGSRFLPSHVSLCNVSLSFLSSKSGCCFYHPTPQSRMALWLALTNNMWQKWHPKLTSDHHVRKLVWPTGGGASTRREPRCPCPQPAPPAHTWVRLPWTQRVLWPNSATRVSPGETSRVTTQPFYRTIRNTASLF